MPSDSVGIYWLTVPEAVKWAKEKMNQPKAYMPLVVVLSPELDAVARRLSLTELEARFAAILREVQR